jgi:hypothetical protein
MRFMAFRRLMRQTLTRGTRLASLLTLSLGLAVILAPADEQDEREVINLKAIGFYASAIFNAGGAEIVAHDAKTQRLFVVNALSATVDVLSIANPALITRVAQIDVKPYGAVANSLAVDKGIVAVAVENAIKTDPGKVVFFSAKDLNVLNVLQVGPLPDMLTFSPDGDWLLIANEGEPNDSYTIDPEGSVSIIQMKGDVAKLKQDDVRTVEFRAFNAGPLPPGIRIFGPGATVSRDIEPEYIAVSPDSKTAYVTLKENNASPDLAVRAVGLANDGAVKVIVDGGVAEVPPHDHAFRVRRSVSTVGFESRNVRLEIRGASTHGAVSIASVPAAPFTRRPEGSEG